MYRNYSYKYQEDKKDSLGHIYNYFTFPIALPMLKLTSIVLILHQTSLNPAHPRFPCTLDMNSPDFLVLLLSLTMAFICLSLSLNSSTFSSFSSSPTPGRKNIQFFVSMLSLLDCVNFLYHYYTYAFVYREETV